MDQIPKNKIGYMQVQFKINKSQQAYDSFAINAYDECYFTDREKTSCHFQVIDDPAHIDDKVLKLELLLKETQYTIMMVMPVHQSEHWAYLGDHFEDYDVYYWCILGEGSCPSDNTAKTGKDNWLKRIKHKLFGQ